jgi:hypothetical protein
VKAAWMKDVKVGATARNLNSKREFTVTGMNWATQKVSLKDYKDEFIDIKLERFYEFFELK